MGMNVRTVWQREDLMMCKKAEEIGVAVTFAHTFVHDRKAIDDTMFHALKQYWTEKEIVELCAYVCFITASQQLGFLFQLQPN